MLDPTTLRYAVATPFIPAGDNCWSRHSTNISELEKEKRRFPPIRYRLEISILRFYVRSVPHRSSSTPVNRLSAAVFPCICRGLIRPNTHDLRTNRQTKHIRECFVASNRTVGFKKNSERQEATCSSGHIIRHNTDPKTPNFTCYAGRIHSRKRCVTVWRPSVRLSVPSANSPWLTRKQHATRPAYISARQ